jgi:excisionase family DNA binding protein
MAEQVQDGFGMVTITQAAALLHLSRSRVYALATEGKLKSYQVNAAGQILFKRDELLATLQPRTVDSPRERLVQAVAQRMVLATVSSPAAWAATVAWARNIVLLDDANQKFKDKQAAGGAAATTSTTAVSK